MARLTKQISDTLKTANLIAIVLVVAIHYNSKHYIDISTGLDLNYYLQEWITNSLARVAVPFFGFAAGFFYFLNFSKLGNYWLQLTKRFWSLIIPYLIAVSIVFFHDLALEFYKYRAISTSLSLFGYHFLHPNSIQFWFLRDLIIIVLLLCPILHILITRFPIYTLILIFLSWLVEFQVFPKLSGWYFVNIEVLFFFSIGCFFAKNLTSFENLLINIDNHKRVIIPVFISLSILRVILAPHFSVWYGVHGGGTATLILYKTIILLGLPTLYIASKSLRDNQTLTWLSSFSFFIFLYHIKPISTFSINIASLLVSDSLLFYLTLPLSILISVVAGYSLKRIAPILYSRINGGR
ncbi:acyltransferase family protein [Marinobacter sp. 1_MG-2023]|uniref:acyltransferase family protein n=1 Tax=Marinobacter sp. 1_MG-2023 TaxID=3062627 RepID=UPI0026E32078|nr:acyltransferase family protein [Marinobacter sp. 1_MG-2023]MDO6824576.1 acyltransferase family protein [Marinobacter sp. 1_MG-2023]